MQAGMTQTYPDSSGYTAPLLGQVLSFADGGTIPGAPPGGMTPGLQAGPAAGPGAPTAPPNPQIFDAHLQDMMRKNPQIVAKAKQFITASIQSGKIKPEDLQRLAQYARACLQNPAMYPSIKAELEKRRMVSPGVLPSQYNQGLISAILIAAQVGQSPDTAPTGQGAGQAPPPGMPGMATGGMVKGPGTGTSDSVPAMNHSTGQHVALSSGEYVIPAHVVAAKGKDFFDSLLRKYHTPSTQANT